MSRRLARAILPLFVVFAGCSTVPEPSSQSEPPTPPRERAGPPAEPRSGGGYYLDDGPGNNPPPNLDQIADAQPRKEALHRYANKPYTVMGQNFIPVKATEGFRERGIGSWYGKRFHGQKTSSGELYDMYAMTAAHPTLPIPSYARVTNLENGRSVVVRINDRGPFLHKRIIDLSYAAAHRLDYLKKGSARLEVEAVLPPEDKEITALSEAPAVRQSLGGDDKHYLQLGAFSSRANAEQLRTRLVSVAPDMEEMLSIAATEGLYRVYLGPYKNRAEATRFAEQVRDLVDVQPHLVLR
ncbi:MAG TPA: septal ring lytic transglycosylase RlpA family protein [Burkholderiales bacterium]|nr:septal ring lytic transglycosylase RlpA family protein [Burkholderiales bacterium]